jgi:hypothetical protein
MTVSTQELPSLLWRSRHQVVAVFQRHHLLRAFLVQRRHRCLHLIHLGDEASQVEVRLLPIARPRFDDVQALAVAVLVSDRHLHPGREHCGEEVARPVGCFDVLALEHAFRFQFVAQPVGIMAFRKADRGRELSVELVSLLPGGSGRLSPASIRRLSQTVVTQIHA